MHAAYSNRAACREKLAASTYGEEKCALVASGLADGRRCVELAPSFARGYQRLATFLLLTIADADEHSRDNDDYVQPDYTTHNREGGGFGDERPRGSSAKADAALAVLRSELEAACRSGMAVDPSNDVLLDALQVTISTSL